jgi:hypothetical protein
MGQPNDNQLANNDPDLMVLTPTGLHNATEHRRQESVHGDLMESNAEYKADVESLHVIELRLNAVFSKAYEAAYPDETSPV